MQDSRLNYVEQHAERIGLDSGRLEALRVSASRSSPMSDTLDLCASCTTPASLEQLVPALAGLLRRGIGLNTRVGTARFVQKLTMRLGSDLKPHAGQLLKVSGKAHREQICCWALCCSACWCSWTLDAGRHVLGQRHEAPC